MTTAVVLLVVLAGCGGGGSGGTPTATDTATVTATPTATPPTTPTETPGSNVVTVPAGWSETGVENASVALDGHYRAVLTGPSATVTYRSRVLEATNERATNTTLEMAVETETKRLYASIEGKDDHREAYFADGTLTQWSVRNRTVVGRSNAGFYRVAQSIDRGVLMSHLLLYELELNGTVTRDGTTALVYDVVGVHNNTLSQTWGTGKSGDGRVVVAQNGRVLEVETTVTYTGGRAAYHYAQTGLGATTVHTPDWMQSESTSTGNGATQRVAHGRR
jgi:hypothetical protein